METKETIGEIAQKFHSSFCRHCGGVKGFVFLDKRVNQKVCVAGSANSNRDDLRWALDDYVLSTENYDELASYFIHNHKFEVDEKVLANKLEFLTLCEHDCALEQIDYYGIDWSKAAFLDGDE